MLEPFPVKPADLMAEKQWQSTAGTTFDVVGSVTMNSAGPGNDARVQYTRLYADEYGESHFEDVDVDVQPSNYAPPAPPRRPLMLAAREQQAFAEYHAD